MWRMKVLLSYSVQVSKIYHFQENDFLESESLDTFKRWQIEETYSQLLLIEMNTPISEIQNSDMIQGQRRKQYECNKCNFAFGCGI